MNRKSLTNKNTMTMEATAIFYNNSADCTLAVPKGMGGMTYVVFERVTEMTRYAKENGIEIEDARTED